MNCACAVALITGRLYSLAVVEVHRYAVYRTAGWWCADHTNPAMKYNIYATMHKYAQIKLNADIIMCNQMFTDSFAPPLVEICMPLPLE